MTRPAVAISLDNVLTDFTQTLVKWHNETYGSQLTLNDFTNNDPCAVWGGTKKESKEKLQKFFRSENVKKLKPLQGSFDILKSLQKYYNFYVLTSRQGYVESATREWLDRYYPGIFQRLLINAEASEDDELETPHVETSSDRYNAKKAMCAEVNALVFVDDDIGCIFHCAGDIEHSFLVGDYPWNTGIDSLPENSKACSNWKQLGTELEGLAKTLELEEDTSPNPGPKLSKYRDNTVTVSGRRPAGFYTLLVTSKLRSQPVIKIFAMEAAISNAVQVAETLKSRNDATATSILTFSGYSRKAGNSSSFRSPRIQISMTRTPEFEKKIENDGVSGS